LEIPHKILSLLQQHMISFHRTFPPLFFARNRWIWKFATHRTECKNYWHVQQSSAPRWI